MKVQPLKGFRDYGPEEMLVREQMIDRVRGVFESFGYAPIHTPALEYSDVLLGKYGDEGEKLLYRFDDNGGRDVALRYDLTVPLARFVASNPNLRFPFRRYHIAPVWRAERPQRGRFREFYQCDVDLLGVDTAAADAECILIDFLVMKALGLDGFRIEVNHRGFLDGLLEHFGVPKEGHIGVMRALDKVDKVSREELIELVVAEGVHEATALLLVSVGDVAGSNQERLDACRNLVEGNAKAGEALDRLEAVFAAVFEAEESAPVFFTPAVARGLDYYTGIVYEPFLPKSYGVGSVMSGGRYDGLIGMFASAQVCAVGISLGIDRLLSALEAHGEKQEIRLSRVMVCAMPELDAACFGIAQLVRRFSGGRGCGVELYPKAVKLKKQLDYANKKGIEVLVIPGPDELAQGRVMVKQMSTGEQETVPVLHLPEVVQRMLSGVAEGQF